MMVSAFALSSCFPGDGPETPPDDEPIELAAPVVVLEGDTASWQADPNADKFEISIDGALSYVENTVVSKRLENGQKFKVRAIGDGKNYTTGGWSNEVEYVETVPEYTITWMCGDTVLEIDTGVLKGTLPEYNGEKPAKDSDAQYHYVFAGWSPTITNATEDFTYTASFTEVPREYVVVWKSDEDIIEIDTGVAYGTFPEYNGEEPKKDGYTFIGWTPELSEVTEDVTYQAVFEEIVVEITYTVVFCDWDGTVLATFTDLSAGASLTAPEVPSRKGYTFIGWDNSFDNVTSDLTVTAQYQAIENQICIEYQDNGDGTLTATFSINGDVNIAMIELTLGFVLANATYSDYTLLASGADANYVDGDFIFSLMSVEDIRESTDLFAITFANSTGKGYIEIIVKESYVSDGTFENITEANVVGTTYVY